MFSIRPLKPTLKSCAPPLQPEMKKTPQLTIRKLEAKLLPGEIVVSEVNFVRKCMGTGCSRDDLWGKLICTNFKVSFVSHEPLDQQVFQYRNRLLGDHDVPLACVEQLVTVNEAKGKQKILLSNRKLKFSPTELVLYCKDLRVLRFRFDEAGPESSRKVCLAIAHYAQPTDARLLFGFEYVGKLYRPPAGEHGGRLHTPLFACPSDWDREIKRTGATEWRVCSVNEGYAISPSLPEHFVVPASLADQDLKQLSCSFVGQRLPLWCWNHLNGSALVRTAGIRDVAEQRKLEQRVCNAVTKSHPKRSSAHKVHLDRSLPSIRDVRASFVRLRQLCAIGPYQESEDKWLSSVESTGWLDNISAFLQQSVEVVYMLEGRHMSVILQEEEDRDLSCVVSCLVQMMLDPHFRSLVGFQSLVQKEWVMGGHRFLDRCNHLKRSDGEESPMFLLFLDCVWQLIRQHPAAFEFTEIYLAVLCDSMWIPIFSTFLFNCPRQWAEYSQDFAQGGQLGEDRAVRFPPVWDWSQQFSLRDQTLFNSPMYVGKGVAARVQNGGVRTFRRAKPKIYSSTVRGTASLQNGTLGAHATLPRRNSLVLRLLPGSEAPAQPDSPDSPLQCFIRDWLSRPADPHGLLLPELLPSHLQLWRFYFLRWVPEARIARGGPITALHRLSLLVDEIETLQARLRQYGGATTPPGLPPGSPNPGLTHRMPSEQTKMYFKTGPLAGPPQQPEYLSSSFPFSPAGNLSRPSALGTPLSKLLSGAGL
ncbi:LOW QUALITY PROTEIN: myotubularin-related protein 10-like [Brienomyrus brachyistius]|uniref:LOW QUALITY PROTEIN: myotubularin-related protein 10-like n=1 Tax=Brienomyrus brachyistius TaxID=42636 RepID=UPI0020B42BB5|nr:LOW QUALITY PROTEIN: myotubularin-related protein 10-like [Brienomyrus brachyistius]